MDSMDSGLSRVDEDLRALRSEVNARFDTLQRMMFQTSVVMIAALIGLIAAQL